MTNIDQKYLDGLTHAQKDALIFALCDAIRDLTARVEALEAAAGKPKKTSKNSSLPPSTDFKANSTREGKRDWQGQAESGRVFRGSCIHLLMKQGIFWLKAAPVATAF